MRLGFSSGLGAVLRQLPAILSRIPFDSRINLDVASLMPYRKHGGQWAFSLVYLYFGPAGILTAT